MTRSLWTNLALGLAILSGSALVGCDSGETTPPATTPAATPPKESPKEPVKETPKEPVKDAPK